MPSFSGEEEHDKSVGAKTLAELVFRFEPPKLKQELENFRIQFEAQFGETDLKQRFTSTWPVGDQEWLLREHPKRYWDGLPPFVKAFIKAKMNLARDEGILD